MGPMFRMIEYPVLWTYGIGVDNHGLSTLRWEPYHVRPTTPAFLFRRHHSNLTPSFHGEYKHAYHRQEIRKRTKKRLSIP